MIKSDKRMNSEFGWSCTAAGRRAGITVVRYAAPGCGMRYPEFMRSARLLLTGRAD